MLPEVVAELADTSELHTRQLNELGAWASEMGGQSATHAESIGALRETLLLLEANLLDQADMARPSRWAWQFLNRTEAEQLWREVRWFVDAFTARYPLSAEVSLPPCWYRHPLAVDELTAVYAAWREAFCGGNRPSTAMAAWWDRWLWPMLNRLAVHADWRECKGSRQHVEPSARQELTDGEFDQYMQDEVSRRPERRPKDLPWPRRDPAATSAQSETR